MNHTALISLLDALKDETANQLGGRENKLFKEVDSIFDVARQRLLKAAPNIATNQDVLNEKANIEITLKAVNRALSKTNVSKQWRVYELYKSASDLLAADYEAIGLIEENKRLAEVTNIEQKLPPGYSVSEASDVNMKFGGYAGFKADAGVAGIKAKIGGSVSLELQDSVRYSKSREGGVIYSNKITAGGGFEIEGGASFNLGKNLGLTKGEKLAGGASLITAGIKGGGSAKVSVDFGIDTLATATERSAATKLDMSSGAKAGSNRVSDSVNRLVFDNEHAVRTSSDISLDSAMLNRRSVAIRRLDDKSVYPKITTDYLDYSRNSYSIDEGSNGFTWVGGTKTTKTSLSGSVSATARVVGAGVLAGAAGSRVDSVNERYVFQPKNIGSLATAALQWGGDGAQALMLKFFDKRAPIDIMRYNEPIAKSLGFNTSTEYFESINDSVRNRSASYINITGDNFLDLMNKRAEAYKNIRTLNEFFLSENQHSRVINQEEALAAARSLNREYGTKIPQTADALVEFPIRQSLTSQDSFSEAKIGPAAYRITSPSNSYSKQYRSFLAVASDIINAYEGVRAFLNVFSKPPTSDRNPYLGYSINTPSVETRINYTEQANSTEWSRISPPLNDMEVSTNGQFKKGYFNTGNNYSSSEVIETLSGKLSGLRPGLSNPTITTGVVDDVLSPTNLNPVTAGSSTEVAAFAYQKSKSVQRYGPRTTNESLVGIRTTESTRTVMPTAPKTSGSLASKILRVLGFTSNSVSETNSTSRLQIESGGREFLSDTIVARYDDNLSKITIGGDFDLRAGGGVTLSAGLGAARSLPIDTHLMLGNDIGAISSTYFRHIESVAGGFNNLYKSDSRHATTFISAVEHDTFVKDMFFGDAAYDHISAILSKYRNAFIDVGNGIVLDPFHDSKGVVRYSYTTEAERLNHSGLLGKIRRDNPSVFFQAVEAHTEAGVMLDPHYVDELLATPARQHGIESDKSLQSYLKTASPEERFDFYKTPTGEMLLDSYFKVVKFANDLNLKVTQNINYQSEYVGSYYDAKLYAPSDTIPVASKANPLAGYVIDLGLDEPSVVPKPPLITADNTLERMGSMATVGETSENLNPLGVPRRKFVPSSSRATADSAVGKQSVSPKELPISINLDGGEPSVVPRPQIITEGNTLERMGSPSVDSNAQPSGGQDSDYRFTVVDDDPVGNLKTFQEIASGSTFNDPFLLNGKLQQMVYDPTTDRIVIKAVDEPSVDSKPPLITADNTLERMGSPAVVDEPSVDSKPPLITVDNTLERMGSPAVASKAGTANEYPLEINLGLNEQFDIRKDSMGVLKEHRQANIQNAGPAEPEAPQAQPEAVAYTKANYAGDALQTILAALQMASAGALLAKARESGDTFGQAHSSMMLASGAASIASNLIQLFTKGGSKIGDAVGRATGVGGSTGLAGLLNAVTQLMTISATVGSLSGLSEQQKSGVIAAVAMQSLGAASGLVSTGASVAMLLGATAASAALAPAAALAGLAALADPTQYIAMDNQHKALDSLKEGVTALKNDVNWDSTLEDLLVGYQEKEFAGNAGALAAKTALMAASTALGLAGLAGNPVAMALGVIAGIGAALTDICQAAVIRNQRYELGKSIMDYGVDKLFSGNFDNQNSKYIRDNIEAIRKAYIVDSSDMVLALGGQSLTKLALQLAATGTSSNNLNDIRAGDPIFAQVKSSMTNFANLITQNGSQVVANLFDFSNGFANLNLALNKTQANSAGRYVTNIYLYNPLAAAGTERREISRGKNSTDVRTYLDGAKGWTFDISRADSGSTISFDTRNTVARFSSTQLSNKVITGGNPDVNYQFRASTATYTFDNSTQSPTAVSGSSAILNYEGYAGDLATRTANVRKMVGNAQDSIDGYTEHSWLNIRESAKSIAPGLEFTETKDGKGRARIQYIAPQMKEASIVVSNSYGHNELVINKTDAIGAEYIEEYIGSQSTTNGKETTRIEYLAATSRTLQSNHELSSDRAYSINTLVATAGDDVLSGYDGMALYGGRGNDIYLVNKATSSVPTTGSTGVQQNRILSIVAGSTTDSTITEQNKIVLSGTSVAAVTFAMTNDQEGLVVLNGENNEIVYVQNWASNQAYKKYDFVVQSGASQFTFTGEQVFSKVNGQLTTGLQDAKAMAASLSEIMPNVDWTTQLVANASSAYVNATTIESTRSDYQQLASDTTTHVLNVSSNQSSINFSGDANKFEQVTYEGLTSGIHADFSGDHRINVYRGAVTDSLTGIESLIGTAGNDIFTGLASSMSIETGGGNDKVSIATGSHFDSAISMASGGFLDLYLGLESGWRFDQVDGVGGMVTITTYDASNNRQSSIGLLNARSNFAIHADSLVANAATFGIPQVTSATFEQQNTAIFA